MPSLTYGDGSAYAEEALRVGLVLGEEQLGRAFAVEPAACRSCGSFEFDGAGRRCAQLGPRRSSLPQRPGVAEPDGRQQVQRRPPRGRDWRRVMRIRMSSGAALAYSTKTSK